MVISERSYDPFKDKWKINQLTKALHKNYKPIQ